MKNTFLAVTFLAVTAFAVACKPSEDNSASQQIDKVKTETKADAQEMKDYAFAQKADFVAKMQGQVDALNKDLDALSAKIEKSSDTVKADAKPKLQALRDEAADRDEFGLSRAENAGIFLLMAFALENEPFAAAPDDFNRHVDENHQADNEKNPHFRRGSTSRKMAVQAAHHGFICRRD